MTTIRTGLATRLRLNGPLIQAPMAGGATTPELVAAVCNAGALGSLGGAYLSPTELQKSIRLIKALTDRPFAVNLFAPCSEPTLTDKQIEAAMAATQSYREELGIPAPVVQSPFSQNSKISLRSFLARSQPSSALRLVCPIGLFWRSAGNAGF